MVNVKKQNIVNEIKEIMEDKKNVLFVDFTGLTANNAIILRRKIRENNGVYKVYKNRLFLKAVEDKGYVNDVKTITKNITGFVFVDDDPTGVAKVLKTFNKEVETFKIKGGLYEDKVLSEQDVIALANIPSKQELIGKLVYVLNAPLMKLLNVLKANQRDLVLVLKQIEEKK